MMKGGFRRLFFSKSLFLFYQVGPIHYAKFGDILLQLE